LFDVARFSVNQENHYMKMRIAGALLALTLAIAGCGNNKDETATMSSQNTSTYPITLTSGNHTTTVDAKPIRIVSLSPTATEDLFAINAGLQVIAVDSQSTYPTNAPKTDLSGFTPNAEAVLNYKPDLVVVQMDANGLVDALTKANVDVLVQPSAMNLDDVYKQIADLGAATDHNNEAQTLNSDMKTKIANEVKTVGDRAKGKAYYHEVDSTYYSSTSSTFIGQIYSLFGLTNIADSAAQGGNQYPQLSSEYIVQKNPDYIFLADSKCCAQDTKSVASRPGWSTLNAVTKNHVVALDDDVASRWGPRVTDLVTTIGDAVQGS
jgi:iron complex transport system substrate-binding protein